MLTEFKVFNQGNRQIPIDFQENKLIKCGEKFEWISLLPKGLKAHRCEATIIDPNTAESKRYKIFFSQCNFSANSFHNFAV